MPKALTFTLKGKVEGPRDAELSSRLERGIFSVGHQMSQLLLAGHEFAMVPSISAAPVMEAGSSSSVGPSGAGSSQGGAAGASSPNDAVGQQQVYLYYKCSPRKVGRKRKSGDDVDDSEEAVEAAEGGGVVASKTLPLIPAETGGGIPAAATRVGILPNISYPLIRARADSEDEIDWWENRYAPTRNGDPDGMTWLEIKQRRCGRGIIHPSCVPITIILLLIFLVVLLPLLDREGVEAKQGNDKRARFYSSGKSLNNKFAKLGKFGGKVCSARCTVSLVETIPEKMVYQSGPAFEDTFDAWTRMISSAESTLDMAVFYWSLKAESTNSSVALAAKGEALFGLLKNLNSIVRFRVVQNAPSDQFPNTESYELPTAEVRNIDVASLTGGVQHTKMIIVDEKHAYVGSANMDWRALSQVKELGLFLTDCPCLVEDLQKIFEIYWILGKPGASIPPSWPEDLDTVFNADNPMSLIINSTSLAQVTVGVSPPGFRTMRRDSDLDIIVRLIDTAREFVYIAVMDYFPSSLYAAGGKNKYWDRIDTALRRAAFDRGVQVRVLGSVWKSTRKIMHNYLKSLKELGPKEEGGLDVDAKLFRVPVYDDEQAAIPFARVNHNKYMVTETSAFIGTSNWSEDYFTNTAGVGVMVTQDNGMEASLKKQLKEIFLRDWESEFTEDP